MIKLYMVSDKYINYLSKNGLKNVYLNKSDGLYQRKYIGSVIKINELLYFVPLSSPKQTDYVDNDINSNRIRKSIVPIIRMTEKELITDKIVLLGTVRISNMIPVPITELKNYLVETEKDNKYARLVTKEYQFIVANQALIVKNVDLIYKQQLSKIKATNKQNFPAYLNSTIDFPYAELLCKQYEHEQTFSPDTTPQPVNVENEEYER